MPKITIEIKEFNTSNIDNEIFMVCFGITYENGNNFIEISRYDLRDYSCVYQTIEAMEEVFVLKHNGKRRSHFPIELNEEDYLFFKDSLERNGDIANYSASEILQADLVSEFIKRKNDIKKNNYNYFKWLIDD